MLRCVLQNLSFRVCPGEVVVVVVGASGLGKSTCVSLSYVVLCVTELVVPLVLGRGGGCGGRSERLRQVHLRVTLCYVVSCVTELVVFR